MSSYIPQLVQDINTVLGMIGFFITVLVMVQVRLIRLSFRSRARLPQITKDLSKAGSTLNKELAGWPANKNSGHEQIKVASSLIDDALQFIPRSSKSKIKTINKKLATAAREFHNPLYNNPDKIWDLYSDIQVVITSIDQIEKNLKWE